MVASEAVQAAKDHILDLFKDEKIARVRLEELEFSVEDDTWEVTIGFQHPWQAESSDLWPSVLRPEFAARTYKKVCIRDDGTFVSMKHRDVSIPA
ncbi:MAG: hypothetical protein J4G03_07925 [Gemmatimonadetes bacterium]|nr:hypothetical protein [Gemmatimonadota bacterium]